jgi:hypothetical protein
VTWVDARGDIHVSQKGSEEATALCGGLGLFGTITEFTLQLTEHSNTHFFTWYLKDDSNIAEDVEKMLQVQCRCFCGFIGRFQQMHGGICDLASLTALLHPTSANFCCLDTDGNCPRPLAPSYASLLPYATQITPHLVVMWRPDIGKYTGHMQEPAAPNAKVIKDAQCNVIPQMNEYIAGMGGPLLRAWQADPFNKNSAYFNGFDTSICNLALTNAVGAAWVTKPGPLGKAGYTAIPLFEGVGPTNHITSTECGDRCAFTSKKMMATALVSVHEVAVWLCDCARLSLVGLVVRSRQVCVCSSLAVSENAPELTLLPLSLMKCMCRVCA